MGFLRVPIRLNRAPRSPGLQIIRQSVCLPAGKLFGKTNGVLLSSGKPFATVELHPLVYRPDQSVHWALLSSTLPPRPHKALELLLEIPTGAASVGNSINLSGKDGRKLRLIETGPATFVLDANSASLFKLSACAGRHLEFQPVCRLAFKDYNRRERTVNPVDLRVDPAGPGCTLVNWVFRIGDNPKNALRIRCRAHFIAETGLVDLALTIHNPNEARHRGGLWDLGDPGSIFFKDLSMEILCPDDPQARVNLQTVPDAAPAGISENDFLLYQASSGGEHWDSVNHVNARGVVPVPFRGFRLEYADHTSGGLRASPVVAHQSSSLSIALTVPDFWQNFPKSLEFRRNILRIGIFPGEFPDSFELQPGEQKTHRFRLCFVPPGEDLQAVANFLRAPYARLEQPQDWITTHGLFIDGIDISRHPRPDLDDLIHEALKGPNSIYANREQADEYGWRNFGEIVADHERAHYQGPLPLISHYNNQFDMVYGFLLNYLRIGDERLFELADQLARHVADIDIYHTERDRSAYNGGLFWHTDHYSHANTATHRSYSRANKPEGVDFGGGPSCEHNYTSGLLLHHCLTGCELSREAVISLADWVIQMDDGARTTWRFLDAASTGRATATGEETYHGPGRGAGNSINTLLDAWRLTGDNLYIKFAEDLLRRCIHPEDRIEELNLLHIELRWSYTVFLSSVSKYLRAKRTAEAFDESFEYARRSLIHYARWMAENELPYFDQQEKMHYPTETWAAQELRKANVLRSAAEYVDDPLKSTFMDRSAFFADRAWSDLNQFETRASARPLAIMMVEALKEKNDPSVTVLVPADLQTIEFPPRTHFVAQKQRILRMMRSPMAALAGLGHALTYWARK